MLDGWILPSNFNWSTLLNPWFRKKCIVMLKQLHIMENNMPFLIQCETKTAIYLAMASIEVMEWDCNG